MADVLVDDHLLRQVLLGDEPFALRRLHRRGRVWTTGHFYLRLCRAMTSSVVAGALSGPLDGLHDDERRAFVAALVALPDEVGMFGLREVGWRMGELAGAYRLNVLGLEVLAAAERVGATVCLAAGNEGPALRPAVEDLGLPYRVIEG